MAKYVVTGMPYCREVHVLHMHVLRMLLCISRCIALGDATRDCTCLLRRSTLMLANLPAYCDAGLLWRSTLMLANLLAYCDAGLLWRSTLMLA